MTHGSLFSGIGGFDLAAEWMGWDNVFHCEWNDFGKRILNYYWSQAISYHDITQTDFSVHRGQIDILTGGFPCQPYSAAGKRLGTEDDRHLWPDMLRAIREVQPRWVVGENVRGLVNWNDGVVFDEVQSDLENEGYEVTPFILPACAVDAPHRRDRVWFVGYRNATDSNCHRSLQHRQDISRTKSQWREATKWSSNRQQFEIRQEDNRSYQRWQDFPTQPSICGGDDGIPRELDSITFPKWRNESIKAYGNAIVPQVAFQIFQAIAAYEAGRT